jgi:hypothetical protein
MFEFTDWRAEIARDETEVRRKPPLELERDPLPHHADRVDRVDERFHISAE